MAHDEAIGWWAERVQEIMAPSVGLRDLAIMSIGYFMALGFDFSEALKISVAYRQRVERELGKQD